MNPCALVGGVCGRRDGMLATGEDAEAAPARESARRPGAETKGMHDGRTCKHPNFRASL